MEIGMTVNAARAGPRSPRWSWSPPTGPPAARLPGFLHRARQLGDFARVYLDRR